MIPTALLAAEEAFNGDPWAFATQLGVGGLLVGFAVWLQDKFATASRKEMSEVRAEMTKLGEKHDVDTAALRIERDAERDRHDRTREQLFATISRIHDNRKD